MDNGINGIKNSYTRLNRLELMDKPLFQLIQWSNKSFILISTHDVRIKHQPSTQKEKKEEKEVKD